MARRPWFSRLRDRHLLRASPAAVAIVAFSACNGITGASDLSLAGATSAADGTPPSGSKGETPAGSAPSTTATTGHDDARPAGPRAVEVVTPDGLDFGNLACGSAPPPKTIEIRNAGTAEITFGAVLDGGTFFSVSTAGGTVASGSTVTLSVSAGAVPNDGPVGVRADTLSITTNAAGDAPHVYEVRLSTVGAIFTTSASSLDFGTVQASPSSKTITIHNDGNMTGTIGIRLATNTLDSFDISSSAAEILPGGSAPITVTAHPPKSGPTQKDGSVAFSSASPLCGGVPPTVRLTVRRPD